MKVWDDPDRGYEVYIDPSWTVPIACEIKWKGGRAMIALITWDIIGDSPPADFLEWLKSQESYLLEQWKAHHP